MKNRLGLLVAALLLLPATAGATPQVTVSILPIHSLVAGVMRGIAEPTLLVPGGASPHTYALRPSDARALQSSDVVFWTGRHLETFLERPIESLAGRARIVTVSELPGLTLLPVRSGGAFAAHDHDQGRRRGNDNRDAPPDMHLWLDPDNARVIVRHAVAQLSAADPANAETYAANGQKLETRLATLDATLKGRLSPVKDRSYIVFHDAYQYFERHFGTRMAGSITVSPERPPSAKRLSELRHRMRTTKTVCLFREPQFPAPTVDALLHGTDVRSGVLDPEGADLAPGPDAYFALMERLGDALVGCLTPPA